MDYKEKYERSLKRAREELGSDSFDRGTLEYIFPELIWNEDERIRKRISLCLEQCVFRDIIRDYERDECLSWLEKQEWSEVDKRKINGIYSILRQAADTHAFLSPGRIIGDKECKELQDFLKSLRPQKQWEPTEEQICALQGTLPVIKGHGTYQQSLLESLYEDLKKLKGE